MVPNGYLNQFSLAIIHILAMIDDGRICVYYIYTVSIDIARDDSPTRAYDYMQHDNIIYLDMSTRQYTFS